MNTDRPEVNGGKDLPGEAALDTKILFGGSDILRLGRCGENQSTAGALLIVK